MMVTLLANLLGFPLPPSDEPNIRRKLKVRLGLLFVLGRSGVGDAFKKSTLDKVLGDGDARVPMKHVLGGMP